MPGLARVFSWERVWHPVHPALKQGVPHLVLPIEVPEVDGIRMIGKLAGDSRREIPIGARLSPSSKITRTRARLSR